MTGLADRLRPRGVAAVALVASLVLNGFLLGLLAVDLLRPGKPSGHVRILSFELRRLADHLPEAAVEEVAAALEPMRPEVEARLDRLGVMRAEIHRLAAAPEPDRAAIDERLAALRAEVASLQAEVQRATFDALLALPPQTRAGLAAEGAPGGDKGE